MYTLVADGAWLLTTAALLAAAAALAVTHNLTVALPVLLDMLLAASLLRLTGQPSFTQQLAGTGLLVAVKRLASSGLRRASAIRRPAVTARSARS